jgi:putative transposase
MISAGAIDKTPDKTRDPCRQPAGPTGFFPIIPMHLPHLAPFARTPIYFFTACTAQRRPILANAAAFECLTRIWLKSAELDGWFVGKFVIMPDHLHLFATPAVNAKTRADWLKTWKSLSSRRLMATLTIEPPLWQPDSFDHILRGSESYAEKWGYVNENPVRAGLVARASDWPWQGELHRLEVRNDT